MRSQLLLFVVAAAVLAARPLAAQDTTPVQDTAAAPNALVRGARALSFALPDGGGASVGIWKMVSERTQLGVEVAANAGAGEVERNNTPDVERSDWSAGVSLEGRRFLRTDGRVAPFTSAAVFASGEHERLEGGVAEQEINDWSVGAEAGIGVEWFPVRHVSVGGSTSLRASYSWGGAEQSGVGDPVDVESRDIRVQTGTSELQLKIYF